VLFLGIGFGIGFGVSHEVAPPDRAPIAAPPGAPAGDFFTVLDPGIGAGPDVDARIEQSNQTVEPRSGVHVATARTVSGSVEVFRWQTSFLDGEFVAGEPASCLGYFFDQGSTVGCSGGADRAIAPEPGVGMGARGFASNAWIEAAPEDGAWFVIETDLGARAIANVVDASSFAAWPSDHGHLARLVVLDAAFNELWSWTPGPG